MRIQFLLFLILSLGLTTVANADHPEMDGHGSELEEMHHDMDKKPHGMEEMHHDDHGTVMVGDDQPVPKMKLIVHKDKKEGWNLQIKLKRFEFAPEMANKRNRPNQGHAHLYINGNKITRIYSDWYYLESLPEGRNEIKVQLNTNNHEMLMYRGKIIEDVKIIKVE